MPIMRGNTSIAASGSDANVIDGQDHEFLEGPAKVTVAMTQSATGLEASFKVGAEDVADGITPNIASAAGIVKLDGSDVVLEEMVMGGRLKIPVENTTAGALTLNWAVLVDYLGEQELYEMGLI